MKRRAQQPLSAESPSSSDDDGTPEDTQPTRRRGGNKEDGPACQACRKKKAKCTRETPCTQCVKYNLECVYDELKNRPGVRLGALEALNQRLSTLENMFLGQGVLWEHIWGSLHPTADGISRLPLPPLSPPSSSPADALQERTARLKQMLASLAPENGAGVVAATAPAAASMATTAHDAQPPPPKRPRPDDSQSYHAPAFQHQHQHQQSKLRDSPASISIHESAPYSDAFHFDLADDLVDSLVDIYFARIHPWIPMLHVVRFRQSMRDPSQRRTLENVFLAIVSVCARFSSDPRLAGDSAARKKLARLCRQRVILQSMESFSVENVQALIICAFDMMGSGRGPSAWSIVGSITRTVEQLQLSVEEDDDDDDLNDNDQTSTGGPNNHKHGNGRAGGGGGVGVLVRRMGFLAPSRDWVEAEGRRRVFWNTFLMDRFCSTATGWNLSLAASEVVRRLPCEGALWERGVPLDVPTPFFGVADKQPPAEGRRRGAKGVGGGGGVSAGGGGVSTENGGGSVVGASGHDNSGMTPGGGSSCSTTNNNHTTISSATTTAPPPPLPAARSETASQDSLGGFAYCIEATESLSLVATFFLQRSVDATSPRAVQVWLARFKQLDARLVQWKTFLPDRWREPGPGMTPPSQQPSASSPSTSTDRHHNNNIMMMDPNLALAHVTHNTAVALLHQALAYPTAALGSRFRLPTRESADTCVAAAREVAAITAEFLRSTASARLPTNPQFSFCLFLCGRVLVAHAAYFSTGDGGGGGVGGGGSGSDTGTSCALAPEFDTIVAGLREIARRWTGAEDRKGVRRQQRQQQSGGAEVQGAQEHDEEEVQEENLASKFAWRLMDARMSASDMHDVRQAAYADDAGMVKTRSMDVAAAAQQQLRRQQQQQLQQQLYHHHQPQTLNQQALFQQQQFMPLTTNGSSMPDGNALYMPFQNDFGMLAAPTSTVEPTGSSPDSISMAFPPLPLALQMPSGRGGPPQQYFTPQQHHQQYQQQQQQQPQLQQQQQHHHHHHHHRMPQSNDTMGQQNDSPMAYTAGDEAQFETLSPFLDDLFTPQQRISMFSQTEDGL